MLLALVQKAKRVVGELWPLTKGQENDASDLQNEDDHDHDPDKHQHHHDDHHHHFHRENHPNSSPTGTCMDPKSVVVVENVTGPLGGCFYWFFGTKPPPVSATAPSHLANIPTIMRIPNSVLEPQNNNNDSNQEPAVVEPVDISLVIGRQLMAKLMHLDARLETRRIKLYQERESIG